jgi:phosphonate transport system substrate-binding protein
MVLEDVWKTFPNNAVETKIIGDYTGSKGAVVLVREGMSEHTCKELLNALLEWVPTWEAVYGGFKPFYYADVHSWFHDLDQLPAGM